MRITVKTWIETETTVLAWTGVGTTTSIAHGVEIVTFETMEFKGDDDLPRAFFADLFVVSESGKPVTVVMVTNDDDGTIEIILDGCFRMNLSNDPPMAWSVERTKEVVSDRA